MSTTVPVKIAERNKDRFKLKVRTSNANGIYVGVDESVEAGGAYFLPQNEELELECFKGALWVLAITAAGDVYVIEEDIA